MPSMLVHEEGIYADHLRQTYSLDRKGVLLT